MCMAQQPQQRPAAPQPRPMPQPEMLGTGAAKNAGKQLKIRGDRLREEELKILGE